ncbi:choice-of-anchor A family protein [Streptomyces lavendulae]|uniref:choice-of-anchor A family protein n=1 Tax=Streptomyces lavendulae TaxID=1914 RepID=UPI0033F078E7
MHLEDSTGHWNSPSLPAGHAAAPGNTKITDRVKLKVTASWEESVEDPMADRGPDGWLQGVNCRRDLSHLGAPLVRTDPECCSCQNPFVEKTSSMYVRPSGVLLAVNSALLAVPFAASPALADSENSCLPLPLGAAGQYAEFVAGDSRRVADSEGAVAIGGNATLGDPQRKEGFSIGSKLGAKDLAALRSGASLVVGGTLTANQVVLSGGKGIYQKLVGAPGASFVVDGPHQAGPSPIDFTKEFERLRAQSAAWGALAATGITPKAEPDQLIFEGDRKFNVFKVSADKLEKARSIKIKVPDGATTLINVTGTSYDMNKNTTYGVYLWDHIAGSYVLDDYQAGSHAFKTARGRLLWNFPQAASVFKNYASWPGTILAPNAALAMGRAGGTEGGEVGPGHINGSVIAKEMTSISGAETHHMPFQGCIPGKPGKPGEPDGPKPVPPEEPSPPVTPGVPGGPVTPQEPDTPEEPGGPDKSSPAAPPEGDLADTGAGPVLPLFLGLGAVLITGGAVLATWFRKRGAGPH